MTLKNVHLPSAMRRLPLYLLPIVFLGMFYFYPLGAIFKLSLAPQGQLNLAALQKLIGDSYYLEILWFTTWQAALSTLLTLALALPGAYIFAHYRFWGRDALKTLSTLPFVLPTVVVANAFTALLGPYGLINTGLMNGLHLSEPPLQLNHTLGMILLAHVFYNYSVALRIISGFWQNLNPNLGQAGQMLGANPAQIFRHITLPLLAPAIAAAGMLVFVFCFTSFGVILILGGPRFATLEVEIYRQAVNLFNLPVAAALSLLQILFTFGLMGAYTRFQSKTARPLNQKSSGNVQLPLRTRTDRLAVGGNLLVMGGLLGLPLLALVIRSFSGKSGFTLQFYRELFTNRQGSIFFAPPGEAIFNSSAIALAAMALATTLGLISAFMLTQKENRLTRWLDPLFMLPLATSAVTLGFGYIIALNKPPLNLRSSLWLVPIAHALVGLPFVIRAVLPALRSINPKLREAAAILGASPGRVRLVIDWPLIRRAVLVGAVFAFTVSMGEFGATVFIARPQTPTMPVAIFRFLGQPGALNYGQALAMSSLLLLVCAAGFTAIERFKLGDEGEF